FDDDYVIEQQPIYPKISLDSLESKIATHYFTLGNLFFTDMMRPDSAYFYYNLLLEKYPNFKHKPRVMFALGTYYETNDQAEKANELYSIIYDDYKTHPIANEAAKKLRKPLLRTKSDPALEDYLLAEELIEISDFDSAIFLLKEIVHNYPESVYKAKSLYTIGWLYENEVQQPDSAISYYQKLLEEYRYSDFALVVIDKVNIYKAEQEKILREKKEAEKLSTQVEPISDHVDQSDTLNTPGVLSESLEDFSEPVDTTQIKDQ
ncbi:MAG TPA: tetratricopeptide repeat protein, partial [Ignavibacteria bacterium]|nr:tetratricopeptide repeat protein [Ignavibacteria bacterium]